MGNKGVRKFLVVDHGFDNYEELLNPERILFLRGSWEPPLDGHGEGRWNVEMILEGGMKEKVGLTESGWEWLKKTLVAEPLK